MRTVFWWGILKEKGHLQDPCIDWSMILIWTVREEDWRVGTGFIWVKVWKSAHTIMILRVFKNAGNLLTGRRLISCYSIGLGLTYLLTYSMVQSPS